MKLICENSITGFRYLWLKQVRGFNPKQHCARCLKGEYHPEMGRGFSGELSLPGPLYYLCGVASPYRWENNFHLAFEPEEGGLIERRTYRGEGVRVEGARPIPFDDQAAKTNHPELGKAYLTCRNFQFGAQHFGGREYEAE